MNPNVTGRGVRQGIERFKPTRYRLLQTDAFLVSFLITAHHVLGHCSLLSLAGPRFGSLLITFWVTTNCYLWLVLLCFMNALKGCGSWLHRYAHRKTVSIAAELLQLHLTMMLLTAQCRLHPSSDAAFQGPSTFPKFLRKFSHFASELASVAHAGTQGLEGQRRAERRARRGRACSQ